MADLQSRLGPIQEEQKFFRNKSWKRQGLHTPNKTATAVWDTSDNTNEADSDSGSGSYDDEQYSISSPPPLSFSSSASPDKPSLRDRMMDGPIPPKIIHKSPVSEQPTNASKSLIDRVARDDDNAERRFHGIGDGGEMDIDQDNDVVMPSGSTDRSQNSQNIGNSVLTQSAITSPMSSASETQNQTFPSTRNNTGFGAQQRRNSPQLTLAERMQNGYAPPRPNYSNAHPSPSKHNFNNDLQMNNVMPHEGSRGSNTAQEDVHQTPLSSDPIRTIMMPLVQQNADSRTKSDDSKNGPPQQTTIDPKVFTDEVSASFSALGRKVHKDMEDRDLPRRSPPRVDPRKGSTIASTSAQERVEASLDSPFAAHAQNQRAYNQHVDSVSYAPSMPSATSTTPRTEENRKVSQPSAPYHHQQTFQRHTPDSQSSRDQEYERHRPSDSRYDGRRSSRSPPRTLPDKPIERRPPDYEFDNTRSRYDERRYRRSPGRKSRSDSRDRAPYAGGRGWGRGRGRGDDYTHARRFSRDDDYYRLPPPPSSYRPRTRSRSPMKRGPRTPPPRDHNIYPRGRSPRPRTPPPYQPRSRSPLPPRRASRSPSRSESYQSSRTRSPPRRGRPRTPSPRRRSSIMSRMSPMSDRRPRSSERIQSRDHSVAMSVSSMQSIALSLNSHVSNHISNEPIQQPEIIEMNRTNQELPKSPSPAAEIIEEQEPVEPEPPRPILPCHNVPGLWFVKLALDNLGTLNCDFEIDQETALKWHIGRTNNEDAVTTDLHSIQVPRKRLSLQICSFSKQLVQEVIETLGTDQTPATIASAIFGLEQRWPSQGQLIIKINPDTANTKTWLPNRLGLNSAPVQIEDCVQEGNNVVQFIQLSGMSDNLFALCASERNDLPASILPPAGHVQGRL